MQDVMFSKRHDLSLKNGGEHQSEMAVSYYLQNKCEIVCHHIWQMLKTSHCLTWSLSPWGMRAARARCGGPDCALIVNPMHHRTVEQLLARDLGDGYQIVTWTFGCSFSCRCLWNSLDFRMLCDTTPNMSFSLANPREPSPGKERSNPTRRTSQCVLIFVVFPALVC